ncbi:MAG: glucans biosynthesis glucosyltransferase MdoH [Rhodobacteraceae bacterium]|nr:glucans biosynthesis glucosyltransferase MdoH [Paracoccaceae bacterium]
MTAIARIAAEPMMPPERPLQRPIQDFRRPYRDRAAPGVRPGEGVTGWRLATFLPAVGTTFLLVAAFTDWFAIGGLRWLEAVLIGLIAFTFFWIALSVSTVTVGIVSLMAGPRERTPRGAARPLDVALLVPIHNEDPSDVFGNALAMIEELESLPHPHRYALFILSDTRDPAIAEQELQAAATLRARGPAAVPVYYRRRPVNTDKKVGNLADWVERWGGGHEAMLVLDADSLMSGEAIVALTDELAADPSAGLIQSFPRLFGAETLFGRVQQFASTIYGAALAEGLATWSDREGNYWGHNAIIRTAAFAACAGLPRLDTLRARGALILSHDFVEAGLLRRAGWGVRFLPRIGGSYEEVPATLVDYARRDRRWCQGNLQHLNILASKGFHPVTRFHLFNGAMSYLLSPAWFCLLTAWALIGMGEERNVIRYFSGVNPQVTWPEMSHVDSVTILVFMYAMLLAPKFMGALAMRRAGIRIADLGGPAQFALSFAAEVVLSVLYAPILMVQQTVAVLRTALGIREQWVPQPRRGGSYGPGTLLKFHALETVSGAALLLGIAAGLVSPWLLPVAVPLALAVPLSALSGLRLTRTPWLAAQLGTPEVFNAPAIIRAAQAHRAGLRRMFAERDRLAAE